MQSPVVTNNIETLSSTRENHYFDRKSARIKPEDLARHVVALANASGGKVVVGIEDDGTVTGFARQGARDPERFEQCESAPVSLTHRVPFRHDCRDGERSQGWGIRHRSTRRSSSSRR